MAAAGQAATQAAGAVESVEKLVGDVINPIKTLFHQLKVDSDFMKAVTELLPDKGDSNQLIQRIKSHEFQGKLQAAYGAVDDLGPTFRTPVATVAWGGTRRKRVKRRASTRGFYRKRRY